MAGAKRSFEDGDNFSQEDDANVRADTVNDANARVPGNWRADGPPRKRPKTHDSAQHQSASAAAWGHLTAERAVLAPSPGIDFLSPLSDELLVRILGNLPMTDLLSLAPVSRRFHRLADDSQLWKAIYYERFVLPRAMRIPGFRGGSLTNSTRATAYRGQQTCSAQRQQQPPESEDKPMRPGRAALFADQQADGSEVALGTAANRQAEPKPDWKKLYRLRHNWARGKCAVEELRLGTGRRRGNRFQASSHAGIVGEGSETEDDCDGEDEGSDGNHYRMLAKVVDGIAITADRRRGLRVWELKSRSLVVAGTFSGRETLNVTDRRPVGTAKESETGEDTGKETGDSAFGKAGSNKKDGALPAIPTSLAIGIGRDTLDIAIGLLDGGFDIWQHDLKRKTLVRRFSHPASSSGPLTGIAYSHPYVLTATDDGLISLYAFGHDRRPLHRIPKHTRASDGPVLSAPQLLTSLRSHTSQPPLALSIRKLSSVTIASIAYTFSTRQGWSIGIQDLHVKEDVAQGSTVMGSGNISLPTVVATRLAHTLPVAGHGRASIPTNARRRMQDNESDSSLRTSSLPRTSRPALVSGTASSFSSPPRSTTMGHHTSRPGSYEDGRADDGPTSLCYTHPYLLATMPDNTLILHLCTSNASTLAISSGIRLWGHTSGISDAEITARGKAVSVSMRGEEMRVWELEGRPAAERGRSVAIRPNAGDGDVGAAESLPSYHWDERRNWVGFDDEMVLVLKETRGGRESLMVYDFT